MSCFLVAGGEYFNQAWFIPRREGIAFAHTGIFPVCGSGRYFSFLGIKSYRPSAIGSTRAAWCSIMLYFLECCPAYVGRMVEICPWLFFASQGSSFWHENIYLCWYGREIIWIGFREPKLSLPQHGELFSAGKSGPGGADFFFEWLFSLLLIIFDGMRIFICAGTVERLFG